jgi:flagellar protein FliS
MTDARSAYRENAVSGLSTVGQVILLYEQIVADLRHATRAIDQGNIEERTNALNHACLIVGHLQNKLDFDAGAQVARNLERFYNLLRQRLSDAQAQVSKPILDELVVLVLDLREAWKEVEAGNTPPPTPSQPASAASDATAPLRTSSGWNA